MALEPRITSLENLRDVGPTAPTDGQVMAFSVASGKFNPVTPPTSGEVAPGTDGNGHLRIARATYDFAISGGAVGNIALDVTIPSGAIVTGGKVQVITPLTSGGAGTAAIQVQSAGDVVAAAVVSGAPWSTAGVKDVVPVETAATSILTTASRTVTLVVGTAALTAGKFVVWLRYYL